MRVDHSPHIILPWRSFIRDRSREPHAAHKLPFVDSLPCERIREHHDERIIYGGVVCQFEGFSFSRVFEGNYSGSALPLHLSPVAIAIALPPSLYVGKRLQLIFKLVSYTQPETTYQIFTCATFNLDVATSKVRTTAGSGYSSTGPSSSFGIKNILPLPPAPECGIWGVVGSCSAGQTEALMNGAAVIEGFIVVQPAT